MIHVAVLGAAGRMGRLVMRAAVADPSMVVTGALIAPDAPQCGEDIALFMGGGPLGVLLTDRLEHAVSGADAVVDFSRPGVVFEAASFLAENMGDQDRQPAYICGVTGLSECEHYALAQAAKHTVVVQADNFSLGVHVLVELTRWAAEKLDRTWDIDILDTHHRMKKDAPSGTALMLGKAAAHGRGEAFENIALGTHHGGGERPQGAIGFSVVRAGGVIGEHEVRFASPAETLVLAHQAHDRSVFAEGALHVTRWAVARPPGLYTMGDVLGLKHSL